MTTTSTDLATLGSLPVSAAQNRLVNYKPPIKYLRRLHLVSSGSAKYVAAGNAAVGDYIIPGTGDECEILGQAVDIVPFAVRDKALDTNENPPVTVFDPEDALYQEIEERSLVKDSGCLCGPSFLVFERNSGEFFEFFCGGVSAQMEAGKLGPFLPVSEAQAELFGTDVKGADALTLQTKPVKRPRQLWFVPVVTACSTPFSNLPSGEVIVAEITKFMNPPTNTELVPEGEVQR